jgi:hypothetical protein
VQEGIILIGSDSSRFQEAQNTPFSSLLSWTEVGLKWLIARLWTLHSSEMRLTAR